MADIYHIFEKKKKLHVYLVGDYFINKIGALAFPSFFLFIGIGFSEPAKLLVERDWI